MTKQRKVRVCASHAVLGHRPGSEFVPSHVPSEQLQRLLSRGSLSWVAVSKADPADNPKADQAAHEE